MNTGAGVAGTVGVAGAAGVAGTAGAPGATGVAGTAGEAGGWVPGIVDSTAGDGATFGESTDPADSTLPGPDGGPVGGVVACGATGMAEDAAAAPTVTWPAAANASRYCCS